MQKDQIEIIYRSSLDKLSMNEALIPHFVCFSQFIVCATLYIAAPFLPLEAEEKFVDDKYLGIMLSSLSIASIVIGPFSGSIMIRFGRRKVMFMSLLLFALTSLGTAFLHYIDDKALFVTLFVVTRTIMGLSSTISIWQLVSKLSPNRLHSHC